MKKSLYLLFVLAIFVSACASDGVQPINDMPVVDDLSAKVELASDTLGASFMSDNQTFSYELNYDGDLLELVDTPLSGASELGPSFRIDGGAELTGSSVMLDGAGDIEEGSTLTSFDDFDMYERLETVSGCNIHKGIIPFGTEALIIQTRVCAGQDEELADAAFFDIVSDLKFYAR